MQTLNAQPIVEDACAKIAAIMTTKVLRPVEKHASQVAVWHEAINELKEQLVRQLTSSTLTSHLTTDP